MSAIAHIVEGRIRDIGGFEVRRVLPWGGGRMVGPFIFLDQMGPADFPAGRGIDVRPHPHIGLATVTYLYEGEILHRDSLGVVQAIQPGDVNWMTAGRGIVHSERTAPELRARGHRLSGLQIWVALPQEHEEVEPAFHHFPKAVLPALERDGARLRVIAGEAFGLRSPVRAYSELFYVDAQLADGAQVALPDGYAERAAYVAFGSVEVEGQAYAAGTLLIFAEGAAVTLTARGECRVALIGGAALEGGRHIWWNFVSSSQERIDRAKADWTAGKFPAVPGESEFIPLPER